MENIIFHCLKFHNKFNCLKSCSRGSSNSFIWILSERVNFEIQIKNICISVRFILFCWVHMYHGETDCHELQRHVLISEFFFFFFCNDLLIWQVWMCSSYNKCGSWWNHWNLKAFYFLVFAFSLEIQAMCWFQEEFPISS